MAALPSRATKSSTVTLPVGALAAGALLAAASGLPATGLLSCLLRPVSRGAAGFWVEDGRIAYPVHEVTVAGNLKDIYRAIVDVGSDVDLRGGIHTGSILVEEMTLAGE
jgi:PmbA protein